MNNKIDQGSGFWHLSVADALNKLAASQSGLKGDEAVARLRLYGSNSLQTNSGASGIILFLSQFKSPVTLLLIIAALLSAGLGDVPDTLIILAIVLISSILGFWQEKGAANAVKELLKLVQLHCGVLRDGVLIELPTLNIVPGDVVVLTAGDIIPGDCLIIESVALFVDEAAFTGETFPAEKEVCILPINTPLAKRKNALFMGSHVISGKATALVVNTGNETEFGKISSSLRSVIPETDFEKGIRKFGYLLMEITLLLVIIIFATNVLLHKPVLESFLFSLALAVGLTPQLLPAIISVNLSAGARRMAKQEVIVKRLSSIENLGSMNVLCADKTGTITEGKVTLRDALDSSGKHNDKVLHYAWLNASLQQGFHNPIDEAICLANNSSAAKNFKVQSEVPYDFIRKRLTVLVSDSTQSMAITKGAVKAVLATCNRVELSEGLQEPMEKHTKGILEQYEQLSGSGFRTLGLAYKPMSAAKITRDDEKEMIFLGFVTLYDPLKVDISKTIDKISALGIKLKIITGDNVLIAKNIAGQLNFKDQQIITGPELEKMSNVALLHRVGHIDIFAEVEPNQKERIIAFLKKAGNVVGYIGDGINDAPALHIADVGISVNTAVDVAKEAADIVLLSKDLNVLTNGITEGRKTFANTMKYIFMATSANFGNMFSMAGASLFLPFLPLLPKQILLTNLLTDFPEMTIATDRVDQVNISSPQRWSLAFIKRFMVVFGLLSSVFDYLTFWLLIHVLHADEKTFQTGWFTESVISAILIVLVVRTRLSFFKSLPGKYLFIVTMLTLLAVLFIPLTPLITWFGFSRLPLSYYGWIMLLIASYILFAEMVKRWFYKRFIIK